MLSELKELLKCLEGGLDEKKLSNAEDAHRRALNYEDVEKLPLIVTYPYPEDQRFMPFDRYQQPAVRELDGGVRL